MKILVRATNWVGDAVLSMPALDALRAHWPQAEITILARPWVADLYQGQAFADRVLSMDAPRSAYRAGGLARRLRRERFDCALLLPNAFSAAWVAWRAGIRERIGYARDARNALLTRRVPVPRNGEIPRHEAFYYLELLHRIGWLGELPATASARFRIPAEAVAAAESRLENAGSPTGALRVAIAPGAAYGSAKCWRPARYAALGDGLVDAFGVDVIFFGSGSEVKICLQIAGRMRHHPINLVGQTPIGELAALLSRCHLFIGNDSGAMHVAAAAGLPVVGIFGSSDPDGTQPMTRRSTIVRQPVSCSPCFLRECPVDHRCMERIEVAEVQAAATSWLEQSPRV